MAGKKRECKSCRKMMRSDNLKKHEKICREGTPSDMFKEISAMIGMKEPSTTKTEEAVKNTGSEVNSPINSAQLRSDANASVNQKNEHEEESMDISEVNDDSDDNDNSDDGESSVSSSNIISLKEIRSRALLAKLSQFVHEINGNDTLKQKMLATLQKLERNSDDNDNDDDNDDEKISFYGLITRTAKNLTKNLRENLDKLLFDMDFGYLDEKIRKMIKEFLDGKEHAESINHFLRNDLDSMKVKLIINEIDRVQRKVKEVLQRLKNIHDSDVIKTLESLKFHEQITDEQFKRMAIVENDLESFAKAMEGSGLWLARR